MGFGVRYGSVRVSRFALLLLALAVATGLFPVRVCHAGPSEDAAGVPFVWHGPHDHDDDGQGGSYCCEETPLDVARPDVPTRPASPAAAAAFESPRILPTDDVVRVGVPPDGRPDLPRGVLTVVLLR